MKYIKNYNQFIQRELFDINENNMFFDIFHNILEKQDESLRSEIQNYIQSTELVQEGFFDKLKERFPNAAKVSNLLSDKAEELLSDIIQKAKDAVSFVKKIVSGIKEFFLKMIEKGKEMFNEQIKQGKLKDKIEELANTKKDGLKKDLEELENIIFWFRNEFLRVLVSSTEKNMTQFVSNEQEPIAESTINEGKNVISTLIHGLEKIPPFSILHEIAKAGEAGANKLISAISTLVSKLGGPSFQLPVIALLIGVVIEQIIKNTAGHWLIDLVGSATPLGMAITGLKMVALFIALVVALDGVLGEKILGGHHDGEHKEKEESEPKSQTDTEDKSEENS
jgi:hypothetical protein